MAWNHKGTDIEMLANGNFKAMFEGVYISKGSLAAVKKDIDRRLELKAKEVTLNLPVVILLASNRFSNENKRKVISSVITGMEQTSLAVIGIEPKDGWKNDEILPASKENEKLLSDYIRVEAELLKIKELVDRRSVGTHFGTSFSRNKLQYHEAVKRLQDNYEAAKKSQSA